jgi:arylsulfatase A-like enzyme
MYIGEHGLFDKRLGLNPATQMPLLIRYPALIKSGTVIDGVINNVDFAETILAMAGADIPASMQGYSFWDLAQGKTKTWARKQTVYTFYSNSISKHYGLVNANYRMLKYIGKDGQVVGIDLFDRQRDPDEVHNLSSNPEYAKVLARMEADLALELTTIDLPNNLLPGPDYTAAANILGKQAKGDKGKTDKKRKKGKKAKKEKKNKKDKQNEQQ